MHHFRGFSCGFRCCSWIGLTLLIGLPLLPGVPGVVWAEDAADAAVAPAQPAAVPEVRSLPEVRQAIRDVRVALAAHGEQMQLTRMEAEQWRREAPAQAEALKPLLEEIATLERTLAEKREALAAAVDTLPEMAVWREKQAQEERELRALHERHAMLLQRHKELLRANAAGGDAVEGDNGSVEGAE